MKNLKVILGSYILAALFLAAPTTLTAQIEEQEAQVQQEDETTRQLATDLKDRLNLTDDQVTEVEAILSDYRTNATDGTSDRNEVTNTANARIEGLLNEGQVSTWNSVRDSWWQDVNQRYQLDTEPLNEEQEQNEEMR